MRKILFMLIAAACLLAQFGCKKDNPNNPSNDSGSDSKGGGTVSQELNYDDLSYFYTEPYLKWDGNVSNIKSYMSGKGWTLKEENSETISFTREYCTMTYWKSEDQILYESLLRPNDDSKLSDYIYSNYTEIKKDKYLLPEETQTYIFVVNQQTALVYGYNRDNINYQFPDGDTQKMVHGYMAYTTPEYMKNHQIICNRLAQYLGTYLRQGTFTWPNTWKN